MSENEVKKENESGISLRDIISVIRQNVLVIIIVCIVCFAGSIVYTRFIQKEAYTAQTSLVIWAKSTPAGEPTSSSMTANSKMQFAIYAAKTFAIVIQTPRIMSEVRSIAKPTKPFNVRIETSTDTFFVKIIVQSTSKKEAVSLANEILKIGIERAEEFIEDGLFTPVDADINESNVSATRFTTRNLAIGLALGVVLSAAYVLLRMMFENTFSKIEDIEELLGLRVLTAVPQVDMDSYTKTVDK